jgi:hypothetical protein
VLHHRARGRVPAAGPAATQEPDAAGRRLRAFDAAARDPGSGLRPLFATAGQSAYAITPAAEPAGASAE